MDVIIFPCPNLIWSCILFCNQKIVQEQAQISPAIRYKLGILLAMLSGNIGSETQLALPQDKHWYREFMMTGKHFKDIFHVRFLL